MAIKVKKNISLSSLTTLHIGGKAKYFVEVENEKELLEAVKFAKEKKVPIFVLGGGSDILVSDEGFPGLVLRYSDKLLAFEEQNDHVLVKVGSGLVWDDLVAESVKRNLQGIECLSGIPGSVGAAPIQNIGAYGQELKDTFVKLTAYDILQNNFVEFDKNHCKFSYRNSIFKEKKYWQKYLITDITLKLRRDAKSEISYESLANYLKEKGIKNPTLHQVRKAVIDIRKTRFENYKKVPNAGSFFKNPVINEEKLLNLKKKFPDIPCYKNNDGTYKCFAGWLIENAGWKGKKLGNAAVSSKHALVLINPQKKAKANEIRLLAENIKRDVQKKFGIMLEPEVQYIGFT